MEDSKREQRAWPMTNRSAGTWVCIALISLAATIVGLVALVSLSVRTGPFDGGLQLASAAAWVHGQRPNIDVYSVYPPLNTFVNGLSLRAFGESVVSYRIVQTLAYLITCAALARYAFRRTRGVMQGVSLAGVALLSVGIEALPLVTALMWSTVATVLYLEARCTGGRRKAPMLTAAGACLGALLWTRPNFALYLATAIAIDTMFVSTRKTARVEALHVSVIAGVVALVIYFAWGGSLYELYLQSARAVSKALATYAFSPVPRGWWKSVSSWSLVTATLLPTGWLALRAGETSGRKVAAALWALSAAIAIVWFVLADRAPSLQPLVVVGTLAVAAAFASVVRLLDDDERFLLLLVALQQHYVLSRPDIYHFLGIFPVIALLLTALLAEHRPKARIFALLAMIFAAPVIVQCRSAALDLISHRVPIASLWQMLRNEDANVWTSCDAACVSFWPDRDQREATHWIREHAAPTDSVFSGLLHFPTKALFPTNDVSAYWLMRRPIGTRYVIIQQGLDSEPAEQMEIARDLNDRGVRWLLLYRNEPDASGSPLDSYVRARYHRAADFGDYEIWALNPS